MPAAGAGGSVLLRAGQGAAGAVFNHISVCNNSIFDSVGQVHKVYS